MFHLIKYIRKFFHKAKRGSYLYSDIVTRLKPYFIPSLFYIPRLSLSTEVCFYSLIFWRFILIVLRQGKKACAVYFFYKLLILLKKFYKVHPYLLFLRLLLDFRFNYMIRKKVRGRFLEDYPILLKNSQLLNYSLNILVQARRSSLGLSFIVCYIRILNDFFIKRTGFLITTFLTTQNLISNFRFLNARKFRYNYKW